MPETTHTNQFLTNFATGYMPENFVADFIAPPFKVNRLADKYLMYTKSAVRLYDLKVKGREKSKEIGWDVDEGTYSCENYRASFFVENDKRNNADKPIDLEKDAVRQIKQTIMLAREKRIYDIAGNSGIVTQTVNAAGDWDDASSGTPVSDILTGIKAVYQATMKKPNRIVVPLSVAVEAIKTTEWKDYFKYTSAPQLFDFMQGLRNLGLEPRIAGGFGTSTQEGGASDPSIEEIWSDSVLLFYAEETPTLQTRTFMYSPFTYKDNVYRWVKEEEDGIKIEQREQIDELLVDAGCAYLITNTL